MNIQPSIFWLLLYSLCLAVMVYFFWARWRKKDPERRFTYSIPEIWALIAGLTPTMLIVKYVPADVAVEMVGLFFLSQLAGILSIKFSAETNPDGNPGWVHVFMGAFVGLAFVVAVPVALWILFLIAIAAAVSAPITIPLMLLTRLARRKRTAEPWQAPREKS